MSAEKNHVLVVACAWCGQPLGIIGNYSGKKVVFPEGLNLRGQGTWEGLPVSHGICPHCVKMVEKEWIEGGESVF